MQRRGGHGGHLGSVAGVRGPLPQLLRPHRLRQQHRVHPRVGGPQPQGAGHVHLHVRLRHPRADREPVLHPDDQVPVDGRGPPGRHVRVQAGQAQGHQDDHHRDGAVLHLLAAVPRGDPVLPVRRLPLQPHHLRRPHPVALHGLRQLLPQPHRVRPGVQALPQGLQEGFQLHPQRQEGPQQGARDARGQHGAGLRGGLHRGVPDARGERGGHGGGGGALRRVRDGQQGGGGAARGHRDSEPAAAEAALTPVARPRRDTRSYRRRSGRVAVHETCGSPAWRGLAFNATGRVCSGAAALERRTVNLG